MRIRGKPNLCGILGLILFLGIFSAGGARAEMRLSHLASLSMEVDDNVYQANRDPVTDVLGRLYYDFSFNYFPTVNNLLLAEYQLGGRIYASEHDKDALINQLQLGYTNYSIPTAYFGLSTTGKLRNIRDGQEDYLKLIGGAFAGKRFLDAINAELRAEYSEFDFHEFDYYDYVKQSYGTQLRYDYLRSFSVGAGYRFEQKTYPFNAYENVGPEGGNVLLVAGDDNRVDNLHEISTFGRYQTLLFERNAFLINLSYTYQFNESNSYGDSYNNHRVIFGLSQDLVAGANLHLLGIFQMRDGREKVLIPHSYSIEEDDENYNQVHVRLTHNFNEYLRLQASYSRFWSHYDFQRLNFVKNLYALGLAVSF